MRDFTAEYRKKVISVDQATELIRSDMEIVCASIPEPQGLMGKFHTQADRVKNVKV